MDLKRVYGQDEQRAKDGVRVSLAPDAGVVIRPADNADARAEIDRLNRQYSAVLRTEGRLRQDALDEIECRVLAHHVIVDWWGLTENGTEVAFSPDTAVDVLRRYPEFRAQVSIQASRRTHFALADDRDGQGNS